MNLVWFPISLFIILFTFNEFVIYYVWIYPQCEWSQDKGDEVLRLFMIADTHLLGKLRGHWWDKLRREWQMWRSYQTAVDLLDPDAVFFLGDLMDEGQWGRQETFDFYSDRFHSLFVPDDSQRPKVYALAGNHDLGFHDFINPNRIDWFENRFKTKTIDNVNIGGQEFVLLTSMALHGDGCRLCHDAETELKALGEDIACSLNTSCEFNGERLKRRPILLQHFPLFRTNDSVCERDAFFDTGYSDRDEKYRSKWDCLSEESTEKLIKWIRPSAVFNGHSHRGCTRRHSTPYPFSEYTVNSFSWRNGPNPSFLLVTIDLASQSIDPNSNIKVSTCFLPNEYFVIISYWIVGLISISYYSYYLYKWWNSRRGYGSLLRMSQRSKSRSE